MAGVVYETLLVTGMRAGRSMKYEPGKFVALPWMQFVS